VEIHRVVAAFPHAYRRVTQMPYRRADAT
jgi:hypothetical protein